MEKDKPLSQTPPQAIQQERLERLSRHAGNTTAQYSASYSKFVRMARLMLPIVALVIIAVLFAWPNMKTQNIPAVESSEEQRLSGRKELLNPVFQSVDQKSQPYKVIAKRAIQGATNENLIVLEEPTGHVILNSGERLDIQSTNGAYRQDAQRLFLEDQVELLYSGEYKLETSELDIDMKESQAWSEKDVTVTGPMGVLVAKGVEARNAEGLLLFFGPVKLTLNESLSGL